jgi:predicted nucleic acid-binding protein
MHCAAGRHPEDVDLGAVGTVLDSVSLIDLTRGDLLAAGTHAPLRSNDAIHLAVALRVGADEIVTYDGELAERATAAGLPVLSPETSS